MGGGGGAEQAGLLDCQAGIDLSLPITFSYMRKQRQDARQVSSGATGSGGVYRCVVWCIPQGRAVASPVWSAPTTLIVFYSPMPGNGKCSLNSVLPNANHT